MIPGRLIASTAPVGTVGNYDSFETSGLTITFAPPNQAMSLVNEWETVDEKGAATRILAADREAAAIIFARFGHLNATIVQQPDVQLFYLWDPNEKPVPWQVTHISQVIMGAALGAPFWKNGQHQFTTKAAATYLTKQLTEYNAMRRLLGDHKAELETIFVKSTADKLNVLDLEW